MLYNAVLILGQNELGPVSKEETGYIVFALAASVMLSAFLFSDIATNIDTLNVSA